METHVFAGVRHLRPVRRLATCQYKLYVYVCLRRALYMHDKDCIPLSNFYFVKMFKSVILQVRKHSFYNHYTRDDKKNTEFVYSRNTLYYI